MKVVLLFGWLPGLERGALDALFHARGPTSSSGQIVLVVADGAAVKRVNQWPLPRRVYAEVVQRLEHAGARTIALDVLFSDPARTPREDEELANACRQAQRVVHAAEFTRDTPEARAQADFSPGLSPLSSSKTAFPNRFSITDDGASGLNAISGSAPLPELLSSAVAVGHINIFPEPDGALRRIPCMFRYNGAIYPSLALATASHFLGLKPKDIIATNGEVRVGERRVPLDEYGETLINWTGNRSFPTYTFDQLFSGQVPDEVFRDRIVLIGVTAAAAFEHHATPFSPNQPAIELQANAVDNILSGHPLRETPAAAQIILLFGSSMLAGLLMARRNAWVGTACLLVLAALLWGTAVLLLGRADLYVPVATPLVAVLLTCGASIGQRQLQDARALRLTVRDLTVAQERYELAVQGANDGLWDWDLTSGNIYFSPRWKSMLGYAENDIGSDPNEWWQRLHPDDRERTQAAINLHLEGRSAYFEDEHRMLHKDDSYRWMLSRGIAVPAQGSTASRMAGSQTDVHERRMAVEQLLHDAFHDSLTKLPNRALFMDRLERALGRAKREDNYCFAVLYLDVDRFKNVNDSLGHSSGDHLLSILARRLEACLGAGDTVARLSGDEFAILQEEIKDASDAVHLAQHIQEQVSKPVELSGHEVSSTMSIGIVVGAESQQRAEELLRDADIAMYRAKSEGKARHEVFDKAMHTRALEALVLENDLRRALEHQEFLLNYQPIVSLASGGIIGFEALVRWAHPERGMISPMEFIPIAEDTGLIVPLDRWVLREACRQTRLWQEQFPEHRNLIISVNLSGKEFSQPDLIANIQDTLRETELDAHCLKMEITESVLMNDLDSIMTTMVALKDLGVQLSLDDFGTGYSSLSYLHRFPMDVLKIDRSFISRMGAAGENSEIVRTILALAQSLGMTVVAEGIETQDQLAQLRLMDCPAGQGYLFSRPLPAVAATSIIADSPRW